MQKRGADKNEYLYIVKEKIEKAIHEIEGGLCYFTAEAKHAQMVDAKKTLETARETLQFVVAKIENDPQPYDECRREGGCVCGGDTPGVRAGCGWWNG
jgi:septation ring formation regulator EzrA